MTQEIHFDVANRLGMLIPASFVLVKKKRKKEDETNPQIT